MITQVADAKVALERIQSLLKAEELEHGPLRVPSTGPDAQGYVGGVSVQHSSFVWESVVSEGEAYATFLADTDDVSDAKTGEVEMGNVGKHHFTGLHDIHFNVPAGALCAIVGNVGSGKVRLKFFPLDFLFLSIGTLIISSRPC